jgi:predicted SAM-dependent methyltransferase
MRLNLGCGNDYLMGWVNIDIDKKIKADVYCDLNKKLPFKNKEISKILCNDVIEHLENVDFFIKELYRVVMDGGIITIRVPSPHHSSSFGKEGYLSHKTIHSWYYWKEMFENEGFEVRVWASGTWVRSRFFSKIFVLLAKIDPFFGDTFYYELRK